MALCNKKYSKESMGFICLKITKYTSYGIKTSCCYGFSVTPIGNNVQEYWNALTNVSGAPQ
jgi:hypothetical protein